jgi:adenosylmethionine-8-amino-7-oxononanoate aminotransferase
LLDRSVARHPAIKEIRLRGLMCGIELAPPTGAQRWGRKVSAECVRRGVLVRPLGDVVVLMPMLTSTGDEIDRIVRTVTESIDAVCA